MSNMQTRCSIAAVALCAATLSYADTANGPDPYADGFGFDTPAEAGWGWGRYDTGSIYAEWDTFAGSGTGTAPDVGVSGTPLATLGWNAGTFAASSGNLYNFTGLERFQVNIDGSSGSAVGPVVVGLQVETWGINIGHDSSNSLIPGSILLNGHAPDSAAVTYFDDAHPSSFGETALYQNLFLWSLDGPVDNYVFDLAGGPHLSLAQLAVDIGNPAPVPVPAAAWLLGSGLAGLTLRRRSSAHG